MFDRSRPRLAALIASTLAALGASHAQTIPYRLSGTVVDADGKPLAQVVVGLRKAGLLDTTDAQGAFLLVRGSTTEVGSDRRSSGDLSARLREDGVSVRIDQTAEVEVSVRTARGAVVSRRLEKLAVGEHLLPLPTLSRGIYLLELRSGNLARSIPVFTGNGSWRSLERERASMGAAFAARAAAAIADTIRATKAGYRDALLPVSESEQSGLSIRMSAVVEDPGTVVNGCPVKMEGWAQHAGTTGGGNATPQKVTSVDELRTLSKDDVPRVLLLEGTYDLGATYLRVGSNKTFLGVGKNTVVKASLAGFSLRQSKNVILRNFTVQGGGDAGTEGGDAVTATQADRLWFDHLTIKDGPDGILDLTQGTTNATISWCRILYTDKNQPHRYAMQFSSGSSTTSAQTDRGKLDITMHHNWFGDLVDQRMPRHLWGKGHIHSSYYNSPNNTYCIGGGSWASLLVENNYFHNVNDPHRFQDDCPTYINAVGNIYDNAAGKRETGLYAGEFPGCVTGGAEAVTPAPWKPPYAYTPTPAKDVPDLVKRCSGPQ